MGTTTVYNETPLEEFERCFLFILNQVQNLQSNPST